LILCSIGPDRIPLGLLFNPKRIGYTGSGRI
jgi:hypothetical protein